MKPRTKYEQQVAARVLSAMEQGQTLAQACEAVGWSIPRVESLLRDTAQVRFPTPEERARRTVDFAAVRACLFRPSKQGAA